MTTEDLRSEAAFDPAEVETVDVDDLRGAPTGRRADPEEDDPPSPRQRFELLDDTGFDEVPARYRRFYRRWQGEADALAPNEVLCPVCKVVIRSARELRPGDRVYCMPCMSRLEVVRAESGRLEAIVRY
ncbi:MAG: hypothetical protein KIS73_28610 [Enhydrobacter sp.]|nr:hypothetical protein [Enhydrobacter sp.]